MRLRRDPGDVAVMREEAADLATVAYYAVLVGAWQDVARCRARLAEIAERLGWEAPPTVAELDDRPGLLDEWAARVKVSRFHKASARTRT